MWAFTATRRAFIRLQALWPGVCAEQPGETEALCTCRAVAVSAVSPLLKYSCKITSACRQSDPADLSHTACHVRSGAPAYGQWPAYAPSQNFAGGTRRSLGIFEDHGVPS